MSQLATAISDNLFFSRRTIRLTLFLLLLVWCFGFSFNSLFPYNRIIIFYPLLKQVYSNVCHQISYKCFELNGIHFLVCARCTGIYTGALLSSLLFLFSSKGISLKINYLFIAAVPMVLDVFLYSTGVYSYSKDIFFVTGLLPGFFAFVFILISIENYLLKDYIKV